MKVGARQDNGTATWWWLDDDFLCCILNHTARPINTIFDRFLSGGWCLYLRLRGTA